MVFETKKLQSETLGEYLLAVRESLGLSLDVVVEKTGIQKRFLHNLESGSIEELPADVYVCGFLRKLAALYAVEEALLVQQYKKERGIAARISQVPARVKRRTVALFSVTPKTLSLAVALLFLVGTVAYVAFQIRGMSQDPTITVFEPTSGSKVTDSFVKVIGKTEPGNQLSINGEPIFVTGQGNFTATVSVAPGQVDLTLSATNKFNKTTVQTLALIRDDTVQAQQDRSTIHAHATDQGSRLR
jgi:cytoskeletal protein RodZ